MGAVCQPCAATMHMLHRLTQSPTVFHCSDWSGCPQFGHVTRPRHLYQVVLQSQHYLQVAPEFLETPPLPFPPPFPVIQEVLAVVLSVSKMEKKHARYISWWFQEYYLSIPQIRNSVHHLLPVPN